VVFERVEYARRLAATRAAMAKAGIDVLVEADPANMYWLTGYDGWSYYVPQAVLVPQTEDEPVWIGRGLDLTGARHTAWLKPENILAFPEDLFERTDRHPMQFAAVEMARRGWDKGRVGLAKDCQTFTQRSREALIASLPNAHAAPSDLLVNWLRLVKSPAELALMRAAARITERIMATFFAMTAPGVRECDVAAELQKVATEGHGGVAGDYPASIPFIAAGPFVATTHLTWAERRFEAGETASVQASGVRRRYHAPLARTMHLGPPPAALKELEAVVLEGARIAMEAARPGRPCESVEAAWRAHLAKHGLRKEARIGYPVGIGYPPDWGERTASFRPGDTTELQENMTFHLFLGMWLEDRSFSVSETIRVAPSGGEPLCDVPRALFAKT